MGGVVHSRDASYLEGGAGAWQCGSGVLLATKRHTTALERTEADLLKELLT